MTGKGSMAKPTVLKRRYRAQNAASFRVERSGPAGRRSGEPAGAGYFTKFVSTDRSTSEKIDVIRSGVRARVVNDMVRYLGVPKNVIFTLLHTPESTAHKLIKDDRTLDSGASERVVRVADITRVAEETFGGRDMATRWLTTPNLALKNATPLSMLDTEPGSNEVRKILSSISHGGTF